MALSKSLQIPKSRLPKPNKCAIFTSSPPNLNILPFPPLIPTGWFVSIRFNFFLLLKSPPSLTFPATDAKSPAANNTNPAHDSFLTNSAPSLTISAIFIAEGL